MAYSPLLLFLHIGVNLEVECPPTIWIQRFQQRTYPGHHDELKNPNFLFQIELDSGPHQVSRLLVLTFLKRRRIPRNLFILDKVRRNYIERKISQWISPWELFLSTMLCFITTTSSNSWFQAVIRPLEWPSELMWLKLHPLIHGSRTSLDFFPSIIVSYRKMIVGLILVTIILRYFNFGELSNPLALKDRTSIKWPRPGPSLL